MTRDEARGIARENWKKYNGEILAYWLGSGRGPAPKQEDYGGRNGWFRVGEYSFSVDELDGNPGPCPVQARFAYL